MQPQAVSKALPTGRPEGQTSPIGGLLQCKLATIGEGSRGRGWGRVESGTLGKDNYRERRKKIPVKNDELETLILGEDQKP